MPSVDKSSYQNAEAVITMLPNASILEQFYTSPIGPFANSSGKLPLLIDCSTIGPDAAHSINKIAKGKGFQFIDAPVSGGVKGAEEAKLTFMIGSDNPDNYTVS
jgi:3-hydroxyisobutyrate dehydrogenase